MKTNPSPRRKMIPIRVSLGVAACLTMEAQSKGLTMNRLLSQIIEAHLAASALPTALDPTWENPLLVDPFQPTPSRRTTRGLMSLIAQIVGR